jgi:predicted metalloprotease with PDZ domain
MHYGPATRVRFARALLAAGLMSLAIVASAEIGYRVRASAEAPRMTVEITVPKPGSKVSFQMPNWAPGAYILSRPARNVEEFTARDSASKALTVTKDNDYTWTVSGSPSGSVTVSYTLPRTMPAGAISYSGPSTYMYVVNRKPEKCRLTLEIPTAWKVATGMDETKTARVYTAPNYDVLADCPVVMGDIREGTYTSLGKPHVIALYGAAKDDVDMAYLTKACKFVTESQADLMGGLPYKKYVWLFSVADRPDGAGGLEHLNSTQIGLASGVGPRTVGVIAHEFFHLWNVKRIRSKPLGPFDYTVLPKTGALWWLEGTTDYFAHTLLHRYRWWGKDGLYSDIVQNYRAVQARPERMEVSPYESSFRVGEANNGIGNSNGYKVSYYDTGWVVGMCLDIEILSQTGGKRSLDDVLLGLWKLTKNDKPGFEEDEIRKQCVKFGGLPLGAFYDQIVLKPGDLPVTQQLAKVGLRIVTKELTDPDFGFSWQGSTEQRSIRVRSARGPAEKLLMPDDVVTAINGKSISGGTNRALDAAYRAATERIKPGDTITVAVRRGESPTEVKYVVGSTSRQAQVVEEIPDASADALKLREIWTSAKRNRK